MLRRRWNYVEDSTLQDLEHKLWKTLTPEQCEMLDEIREYKEMLMEHEQDLLEEGEEEVVLE